MKIDFKKQEKICIKEFKGGLGELFLKKFEDDSVKIMNSFLSKGSTIGLHTHTCDNEIIYVISGTGYVVCDGVREELKPKTVHYCPKNSEHTIVNDGDEELQMYAIVVKNL